MDEISLKKLKDVECEFFEIGNIIENIKEYDVLVVIEIIQITEIKKLNKYCNG